MAKKNINNDVEWGDKLNTSTEFKKATALEDGQSIVGTILAFQISSKFPETTNLVMEGLDGKKFSLSPAGNLKYAIKDGLLEVGMTYKIQREGTRVIKGKPSAVFGIYPAKNQNSSAVNDDI